MDKKTEHELRELAKQHDLDPDAFLALAKSMSLPDDTQEIVDAVLADVATFSMALDRLDR